MTEGTQWRSFETPQIPCRSNPFTAMPYRDKTFLDHRIRSVNARHSFRIFSSPSVCSHHLYVRRRKVEQGKQWCQAIARFRIPTGQHSTYLLLYLLASPSVVFAFKHPDGNRNISFRGTSYMQIRFSSPAVLFSWRISSQIYCYSTLLSCFGRIVVFLHFYVSRTTCLLL